jgi:hypothetical protein
LTILLCGLIPAWCQAQVVLFSENFDGLTLGPSESPTETSFDGTDWTATPPPGWAVDNSQHAEGVPEFDGWTFVDPEFWSLTAAQDRDQFTKGMNVIAVADPDEWDDGDGTGTALGTFNSFLSTPPISLAGAPPDSLQLQFDSSWRPFANQTGTVTVAFDGGPDQELTRFDGSVPEALNETVRIPIGNPGDAANMVLTFGLAMGGNDWWWAVDNLAVFQGDPSLSVTINRDSREVTMSNGTGTDVPIKGYSILSANGALVESNFNSLTDNGEEGWIQLTGPGSASDLSEGHLTTGTIGDGRVINLGDAWVPFYEDKEDITFEYLDGNGDLIEGSVRFVGNGDASFQFLDLNFDGAIDVLDWETYVSGLSGEFPDLSLAQAYGRGDLNGDLENDHADFVQFQDSFDAANGAGAFAAMLENVPEPSSLVLLMSLPLLLFDSVRRRLRIALDRP